LRGASRDEPLAPLVPSSLVGTVVLGGWLDSLILEVFSYL